MTDSRIDQLVAAVCALPRAERLGVEPRVIESLSAEGRLRVTQEVAATVEKEGAAASMLGLFADEPETVDATCQQIYAERGNARPRALADE